MTQERIAFITSPNADTASFAQQANLKPRRLRRLPNELSPEYQIRSVLLEYIGSRAPKEKGKENPEPYFCIITEDHNSLLNAARKILNEAPVSTETIKNFFGVLTLVKLNSTAHSVKTDETTGIRVAELMKGETPNPIHPTPAS